ncbi:MAG: hypothetical protein P8R54_21675 [Myxococcota bacterium]|nr:hypothetical protein [Myxococcota bacterium]
MDPPPARSERCSAEKTCALVPGFFITLRIRSQPDSRPKNSSVTPAAAARSTTASSTNPHQYGFGPGTEEKNTA